MNSMCKVITLAAVPAIVLGIGLAACSTTTVRPAAATAPAATSAPASSAPATSALPSNTGPIGTTFTVTTQENNGNNVSYNATAVTVDQHAGLGPYETLNNNADHMAAVRFTLKGVTGQVSDDANSDAAAIGSDTTEYQPSYNSVTDGGNFNSGEFAVSPGEVVSGWVSFEVPPGKTIASVQWSPNSFSGSHATWTMTPVTSHAKTVYVTPPPTTPPAPAVRAAPPVTPSARPPTQVVNAEAVVAQFYQDITDKNYQAAWSLGGDNLSGGVGYGQWVAGYATTASISLGTFSSFGSDQVAASLSAVQTGGSTTTYQGTYTVQNGVIVSANIVQTS
jgi:hypothetical protein